MSDKRKSQQQPQQQQDDSPSASQDQAKNPLPKPEVQRDQASKGRDSGSAPKRSKREDDIEDDDANVAG